MTRRGPAALWRARTIGRGSFARCELVKGLKPWRGHSWFESNDETRVQLVFAACTVARPDGSFVPGKGTLAQMRDLAKRTDEDLTARWAARPVGL